MIVNQTETEKIKAIKQSFRAVMNGVVAQSMRERGVEWGMNWGVPLPALKAMAAEMGDDYALAAALWKEDVRECKILATLTMPAGAMAMDLAELWMEQIHTRELAELTAFNLFQRLPFAADLAFRWMAQAAPLHQIAAFNILARLFAQGKEPNEGEINEFLDQAHAVLQEDDRAVKHAAMNALQRFGELSDEHRSIAAAAMRDIRIDGMPVVSTD